MRTSLFNILNETAGRQTNLQQNPIPSYYNLLKLFKLHLSHTEEYTTWYIIIVNTHYTYIHLSLLHIHTHKIYITIKKLFSKLVSEQYEKGHAAFKPKNEIVPPEYHLCEIYFVSYVHILQRVSLHLLIYM